MIVHHRYNGFTARERRAAGHEIGKALVDGRMSWASSCSVCGTALERPHQWHLEDYTDVLSARPVCRRCHHAIHIRFAQPAYWARLKAVLPATSWVHRLSVDPAALTAPFTVTYPRGLSRPV